MPESKRMKNFEVVFDGLNASLFGGEIPGAKFTFDISKKFAMRWDQESVVIGSEFVSLNCLDFLIALVHEMVHMQCRRLRLDDLGINQYHKKDFMSVALSLGFFVVKHKSQGWSIISPVAPRNTTNSLAVKVPVADSNRALCETLDNIKFDREGFKRDMATLQTAIMQNPPSKTFFLKYVCGCPEPHNSIRSGRRPLSGKNHPAAMCKSCGADYVCVSDYD